MGDVPSLAIRHAVGNISYTCKPALIKKNDFSQDENYRSQISYSKEYKKIEAVKKIGRSEGL